MEFGLSQDQLMLGDSVRKFLASEAVSYTHLTLPTKNEV